jgi:hypothetical protein
MNFENTNPAPIAETIVNSEVVSARTERWNEGMYAAEIIVAQIEDFERMDIREQISVLKEKLIEIVEQGADYYTSECIAATITDKEITLEQERLEETRPTAIVRLENAA